MTPYAWARESLGCLWVGENLKSVRENKKNFNLNILRTPYLTKSNIFFKRAREGEKETTKMFQLFEILLLSVDNITLIPCEQ